MSTTWKIVIAAVAVVVAIGIFTNEPEPAAEAISEPTTTTQAPATTAPPPPATTTTERATTTTTEYELTVGEMEGIYVAIIRAESSDKPWNWVDAFDDATLVEWGYDLCDGFDDNLTWEDMALINVTVMAENDYESDTDYEMLGYAMGAAIEAFCPEYAGLFDE